MACDRRVAALPVLTYWCTLRASRY